MILYYLSQICHFIFALLKHLFNSGTTGIQPKQEEEAKPEEKEQPRKMNRRRNKTRSHSPDPKPTITFQSEL